MPSGYHVTAQFEYDIDGRDRDKVVAQFEELRVKAGVAGAINKGYDIAILPLDGPLPKPELPAPKRVKPKTKTKGGKRTSRR